MGLLMLILMQTAMSRGGHVAPVPLELPGLVSHHTLSEESDGSDAVVRLGSLPNLPVTNQQRIDLDDPTHIASTTGINGGLAALFDPAFPGQGFTIKDNPAGAAGNSAYYVGGRGSWLVLVRVKSTATSGNSTGAIITAGGEVSAGWRFGVTKTTGPDVIRFAAYTQAVNGDIDTLNGPVITGDEWWTGVFIMNATTGVMSIYALKGTDTEEEAHSSPLSERALNLCTSAGENIGTNTAVYVGRAGGNTPFDGALCDLYVAKFGPGEIPWGIGLIRQIHNGGVPPDFATTFTVPTPNDPEPSGKPFSNVQETPDWLNTDDTNTQGLYWHHPYRMPSNTCRFFWSSDHGNASSGPTGIGVYTATSAGPGTAPTVFTKITGIPINGTLSGYTIDTVGTPTYRYQADDATGEPHYLYVNYVSQPPPSGEGNLEQTYLFSSASEDFASVTNRGPIAVGVVRFHWLGYQTAYDSAALPFLGAGNYASVSLKDLSGGPLIWTPSTDPTSFPVGAANSVALDGVTAFPARCQAGMRSYIFTPDAGVRYYAVSGCALPTGRGVCVVELEVDGDDVLRPTGKLWQLGTFDTDVFPTVGYTQDVAAFWESGVLYVYRLRGFYPPDFAAPGIEYEQIDLITCDFPA